LRNIRKRLSIKSDPAQASLGLTSLLKYLHLSTAMALDHYGLVYLEIYLAFLRLLDPPNQTIMMRSIYCVRIDSYLTTRKKLKKTIQLCTLMWVLTVSGCVQRPLLRQIDFLMIGHTS
jgi:hypothetical protein